MLIGKQNFVSQHVFWWTYAAALTIKKLHIFGIIVFFVTDNTLKGHFKLQMGKIIII